MTASATHSVDAAKEDLRQTQRRTLSNSQADVLHTMGERVCERALALAAFRAAEHVALYVSIGREIPTQRLIDHALAHATRVALPAWVSDEGCYRFCRYEAGARLVPGPLGIAQPDSGAFINAEQLDFVFLPGLAFDLKGGRLGHGGGHYDRLLASVRDDASVPKAGLAYAFQKVASVPVNETDVRIDILVTEENEYTIAQPPQAS